MKISSVELNYKNFLATAFLLILLLIIPFIYTYSTLDPGLVPRHLALNLLLLIMGIISIILIIKQRDFIDLRIFNEKLFMVYAAYLMVAAISVVFALNKSEAVFEWFKMLTFFYLFGLLTIVILQGKANYIFLIKLIIIYTIVISLWGCYEIATISSIKEFDHQSSYFIRAFSSNRNLYSQILFLTLPFSLFGIFRLKSTWKLLSILGSIFVVILVTILLTRSVWIGLIVSFFSSVIVTFLYSRSFNLNRGGVKIIGLAFIAGIFIVAMAILLYSKFGETEVFKKQTYSIGNYTYGSTLERIDLWQNTLQMSLDNPFTGVGPGNWRIVFPSYGLENLRSETGEIFFQRPHNDFLWVLAENGIFGLILYLLMFCFAFYYLLQLIKKSPDSEKKYLALAMIFGLTGYLTISFFSFPKERIEHQIYLCIILAIALVEYHNLNPKTSQIKKSVLIPVFLLFLILMIVGSYVTFNRLISEKNIANAYNYREQQLWKKEIESYQLAETSITQMDAFSTPLSWYIGEAWFNLNEIDSAHFYFSKAYQVNPFHLHVLNNLGTTYELKGNSDKAKVFFLKAHHIAPRFEDPLFNLCALYFNNKDYDLAYESIRKIDINTKNPKYQKFLTTILKFKIDEFNLQIDDDLINTSIHRIRNNDEWMQKVHNESIENEIIFEKKLLMEVIYLLESVDSTITHNEAIAFSEKYNLN